MVFPLYDDNPFKRARIPFATWGLILLNVLIFFIGLGDPDGLGRVMLTSFGATPAVILHEVKLPGNMPPELTLVTSLFLHGGWEHILGNMIYLWVFGDDIEDALGPVRFLIFYLLAGIAATAAFIAMDPHSTIPLVGASGAVSGILAAYVMLRPCAKVAVFVFRFVVRVRAFWVIGAWVLLQLFSILSQTSDGVAYTAHAGGLVAGALLFLVMRPAGVELFDCVEQRSGEPGSAG